MTIGRTLHRVCFSFSAWCQGVLESENDEISSSKGNRIMDVSDSAFSVLRPPKRGRKHGWRRKLCSIDRKTLSISDPLFIRTRPTRRYEMFEGRASVFLYGWRWIIPDCWVYYFRPDEELLILAAFFSFCFFSFSCVSWNNSWRRKNIVLFVVWYVSPLATQLFLLCIRTCRRISCRRLLNWSL